ncbi:MAG: RnfABCDGE type electron transport complex subunit D, partial [Myxococcales bacterium]
MPTPGKTLEIRTSPHIVSGYSVDSIMFNVVLALLPATGFAVYAFGLAGLLTLIMALLSCVLTEHVICRAAGKPTTIGDWSVTITGLLYGLTLPPGLPLWMVAVGGVICVAMGKALFGGLGYNTFNPALVGRAVLQAAFPVAMTTWIPGFLADRFVSLPSSTLTLPFTEPAVDAITAATPLALWKFSGETTSAADLAMGFVSGSAGETSSVLILVGGVYLIARNMMNWRIPVAIFATVIVSSGALHLADPSRYASPGFMLFSGGLMLGAMFMATDMVGSPMTSGGCYLYGALIGLVIQQLVFKRLRRAPALARVVASVGLFLYFWSVIGLDWPLTPNVRPLLPKDNVTVLGRLVGVDRLLLGAIVAVLAALLWLVSRHTRFGLATTAASENQKGAVLAGLNPDRLAAVNWMIATSLAGLAMIFSAQIVALDALNNSQVPILIAQGNCDSHVYEELLDIPVQSPYAIVEVGGT